MENIDIQALKQRLGTKSAMIRHLHAEGITIADIARLLDIRYQFAYNVIQRYGNEELVGKKFMNSNQRRGDKTALSSPHVHSSDIVINGSPTREDAENAVRTLIAWLGENPDRASLQRTPYRVTSALEELCDGYVTDPSSVLTRTFPAGTTSQDMVILSRLKIQSLCEHHMLPFVGEASVAYIPGDRLVGLSKIARLVEVLGRRLQTQEKLTRQIADAMEEALAPSGVAVFIVAEHDCMKLRGVKMDNVNTTTTCFTGAFERDDSLKSRFFSTCGVSG